MWAEADSGRGVREAMTVGGSSKVSGWEWQGAGGSGRRESERDERSLLRRRSSRLQWR